MLKYINEENRKKVLPSTNEVMVSFRLSDTVYLQELYGHKSV